MIDFRSGREPKSSSFDYISIRIASPEEIRGPRDPKERERLELQGQRTWRHRESRRLKGTRACVVGSGPIGRAIVATLKALKAPGTYEKLERQGTRLMEGVRAALTAAGVTATVTGFPEIFHVGFGLKEAPRNYRDIISSDRAGYVRLTTALLQRGVRVLERGAWFISTTHEDAVIDETLDSLRGALASL